MKTSGKFLHCVAISDTHNAHKKLNLPSCDILIHAGDATGRGYIDEYEEFSLWYGKQNARYKIHIAGNHCLGLENKVFKPTIEQLLKENKIIHLNENAINIEGINFYGSPITPTFGSWAFMKNRGKDIKPHWDKIPLDTHVLITHGPPYGILDSIYNSIWDYQSQTLVLDPYTLTPLQKQSHVGCEELRKIVDNLPNLKMHVFGHIHESQGHVANNDKHFINASSLDQHYKHRNRSFFEFDIHYYIENGVTIIDFIDIK